MTRDVTAAPPPLSLRATIAGDGTPGPIEERVGRRLMRVVDPASEEGARLLRSGGVTIVGPGGESFGRITVEEAWNRLVRRLEARLDPDGPTEHESIREGLDRLRERTTPAIQTPREGRA
jgi:hypothetical protein